MRNFRVMMIAATAAVAVAGSCLVGCGEGGASAATTHLDKLAGSWNVTVTLVAQGITMPVLLSFTGDGVILADEAPSPFETTGHGNWVTTGPTEAAFTFMVIIGGAAGSVTQTYTVVGKVEYDAAADTWSGPFTIKSVDPTGTEIFSDQGTESATRIAVQMLN